MKRGKVLGEKYPNKTLNEIFEVYYKEFESLAEQLEIYDRGILELVYSSVSISPLEVKKKGKVCYYVQLKAFLQEEKRKKSRTLKTWKEEEVPYEKINRFIKLYRGLCFLRKAITFLG